MKIGQKYYKTTREHILYMINEFGSAENLINHLNNNNLGSIKEDDLHQNLRDFLNYMTINKIYSTNEIQSTIGDIKPALTSKRLNQLKKKGYVSKIKHGYGIRIR